jgi:ABC-type antimicrobial peptide transport system permease subunit
MQLDPDLPAYAGTLDRLIHFRIEKQRSLARMLGLCGALALLVASLGVLGVTAHGVAQRTREIGIRMALGAASAQVIGLFVQEGAMLALVGVVLGLGGAAVVGPLLASSLFGIGAIDPLTFGGCAAMLGAVAVAASYLAARSGRVDPLVAMRHE